MERGEASHAHAHGVPGPSAGGPRAEDGHGTHCTQLQSASSGAWTEARSYTSTINQNRHLPPAYL